MHVFCQPIHIVQRFEPQGRRLQLLYSIINIIKCQILEHRRQCEKDNGSIFRGTVTEAIDVKLKKER